MPKDLSKGYNAQEVEDKIYQKWEASGAFTPKIEKDKKPFVISMPPPNATGILHIGHAMFITLQDLMTRYHRLLGQPTLWLPGTDHASIATQAKVTDILAREGKSKEILGRERFLERVDQYVAASRATIRKQIRKMGASCDWSRERFTLDHGLSCAVREIFVRMYRDGLIYRGYRIVNWCPCCASTLSDDEVEYQPVREKLYWLRYGPFRLATARPETKLGDTAVAVHPDDVRYQAHIGQKYQVPGVLGKFEIKVVADPVVDRNFGTGVIKVTPAHDFTDYEIAQRHGLPLKQVINKEGRMMANCGKYAGLTTRECREAIVKDLEQMGLLEKVEDYEHNLSICYRCETPIEPLPSLQWFVQVDKKIPARHNKSLKALALEAVRSNQIKIIPERFHKIYFHWLENLRDWCISRQIWYGHRIPVWYCQQEIKNQKSKIKMTIKNSKIKKCNPIVSVNVPKKCPQCGGKELVQDPDTLDTWFSSGLWTFSTLGWPKQTIDFKYFHPTTVMETGYDILFFWVARMIIMSEYALSERPFKTVYLHGLVRDKKGRKMSKSLGNIIDPLEMIKKFGTDAVRLSLVIGNTPGNDSRIYEEKIAGFRNFVNKLWNMARFVLSFSEENSTSRQRTLADRWILSRFNRVLESVTKDLASFRFSPAGETLRAFSWDELADWYLEIAKIEKGKKKTLIDLLGKLLRLWHPFMPFVTEEIYQKFRCQKLGVGSEKFLMVARWPKVQKKLVDSRAEKDFKIIQEVITAIRNARSAYRIPPRQKIPVILAGSKINLIKAQAEIIKTLARVDKIEAVRRASQPQGSIGLVLENLEIYLLVAGILDIEKERQRISQEIQKAKDYLVGLEKKLRNKEFVAKAPVPVVQQEKSKIATQKGKLAKLEKQLTSLN